MTQNIEELFPSTKYYQFESLPWLKIEGGLKLLDFQVKHSTS